MGRVEAALIPDMPEITEVTEGKGAAAAPLALPQAGFLALDTVPAAQAEAAASITAAAAEEAAVEEGADMSERPTMCFLTLMTSP